MIGEIAALGIGQCLTGVPLDTFCALLLLLLLLLLCVLATVQCVTGKVVNSIFVYVVVVVVIMRRTSTLHFINWTIKHGFIRCTHDRTC